MAALPPVAVLDAKAAEESALLLITGGLSMLGLIIALVLLAGLFSDRTTRSTGAPAGLGGSLRPSVWRGKLPDRPAPTVLGSEAQEIDRGLRATEGVPITRIDDVLERLVDAGSAEPRVLSHEDGYALIRIYWIGSGATAGGARSCAFERGFLKGGFDRVFGGGAEVVEVACDRRAGSACDFEVMY